MIKLLLQQVDPYWKAFFWIALTGTYIAAILPQEIAPTLGALSDKGTHVLAFSVLTVLLRLGYPIGMGKAAAVLLFYGIFIEISQFFTPNRSPEVLDVVADMIGIGMGLVFYLILERIIDVHD